MEITFFRLEFIAESEQLVKPKRTNMEETREDAGKK